MRAEEGFEESLAAKFQVLFPHLDERQRRLLMGAEARVLGHGGIRLVARAAGVREATVALGVTELDSGAEPLGRARRPGGGRKRVAEVDPGLRPALLALVEPGTRGDPMSPLRWTTKSTRKLAGELTRQGHRVSADTVGDVLREEGFSLQGNAKTIEGRRHPDRDAQFRYIGGQVAGHLAADVPVISVDAKKKEKVGNFAGNGAEWEPEGRPVQVRDHDFPDKELGKAVPYGIYDVAANTGWVNVGTDGDTAAFAWSQPPRPARRSRAGTPGRRRVRPSGRRAAAHRPGRRAPLAALRPGAQARWDAPRLAGSIAPTIHRIGKKIPIRPSTQWPLRKVMRATVNSRTR